MEEHGEEGKADDDDDDEDVDEEDAFVTSING